MEEVNSKTVEIQKVVSGMNPPLLNTTVICQIATIYITVIIQYISGRVGYCRAHNGIQFDIFESHSRSVQIEQLYNYNNIKNIGKGLMYVPS